MPEPSLRVADLRATWDGRRNVTDATFTASRGDIVAMTGENGSGKSTILLAIAGLVERKDGTVQLDGVRLDGLSAEARARYGVTSLLQSRHLFGSLSVAANATLWLRGTSPEIMAAATERLSRAGLAYAVAHRRAGELSGGEARAVATLLALSRNPRLFLIDEPEAGLEPPLLTFVEREIRSAATNSVIVLATHDSALPKRLGATVMHVIDGRVVALTKPS